MRLLQKLKQMVDNYTEKTGETPNKIWLTGYDHKCLRFELGLKDNQQVNALFDIPVEISKYAPQSGCGNFPKSEQLT